MLLAVQPGGDSESKSVPTENRMNVRDLAKYFIHGVAFSLLFMVLSLAWAATFLVLLLLGSLIGLVIGIGLLMLVVGAVNTVITELLWFHIKHTFWAIFLHGLALFVILLLIEVVIVLPPLYFSRKSRQPWLCPL